MSKHNLMLTCKSYIGDLGYLKILKDSIDKFNKDNIPFCLVAPNSDIEKIKSVLINGDENYEMYFVTDEEILELNFDEKASQGWIPQQIIKLNFHKVDLSNFYCVIDSDCYFITDFGYSDFMYDEFTPYTVMYRIHDDDIKNSPQYIVKNYFKRKGLCYGWAAMPTIFSAEVLKSFQNYLVSENLTMYDILKITPYEFIWYGEYLYKIKPYEIIPTDTFFYSFWYHHEYLECRKKYTVEDLIARGYIGINMQAGWVKEKIYKPSKFIRIHRYFDKLIYGLYFRNGHNILSLKWFEIFIRKCIRDPLKELIK